MHFHNCRCFLEHLRMLWQSLRALCLAPGGPGSIWKCLGGPVRATGVPRRFVCGFRTDLHLADVHGTVSSAKDISIQMEWHRQSGLGPSEPSEASRWQLTLCLELIRCVALHIALPSQFHRFFFLCQSLILNNHSDIVATCDTTSEWVYLACTCIGISM
jgi:hypothetical protein